MPTKRFLAWEESEVNVGEGGNGSRETVSHQQLRPDFIRSKRQKRSKPEYQVQNRYSGISFFDQDARPDHHVFQIGVGPVHEAMLSLTRTELLVKLSQRPSAVA